MSLRAHCNFILFISIAVADLPGPCQVSSSSEGSGCDGVRSCRAQNLLQLDAQGQPIKKAISAALSSIHVASLPLASFVQLGSEEFKPSTNQHVSLLETQAQTHSPSGQTEIIVACVVVGTVACLLLVFALSMRTTDDEGNIRTSFAKDHANTLLKGQPGSERASQVLSDKLAQGATAEEAAAAAKEQMRKDQRVAARKKSCC